MSGRRFGLRKQVEEVKEGPWSPGERKARVPAWPGKGGGERCRPAPCRENAPNAV